ncbi:MAG: sugar phosphate isomerase/epimerase [Clostridia bacterium]|nr:sugar phosphate isomerase/epimerase [Clostridia bacterium]
MKFGICTGLENAPLLKTMGYDYIEGSLSGIAKLSKEQIKENLRILNDLDFKMDVTNMFFPGEINLAGESTDINKVKDYVYRAFDNAAQFDVNTCVLGSGNARRIPDGFDYDKGYAQVLEAVSAAGEIAQEYAITIAIEPLNSQETNIFTTVSESLEACKKINLKNICVLADLYHMFVEKEDFSILTAAGEKLHHIHFCNPVQRIYPEIGDDYDYSPFVEALKNYQGKISIEARTDNIEKDGIKALEIAKQLFCEK